MCVISITWKCADRSGVTPAATAKTHAHNMGADKVRIADDASRTPGGFETLLHGRNLRRPDDVAFIVLAILSRFAGDPAIPVEWMTAEIRIMGAGTFPDFLLFRGRKHLFSLGDDNRVYDAETGDLVRSDT